MKYITTILLLTLAFVSKSQTFINRAGPANTVIDQRLGAAQNFFLPRLADTTLSGGLDTIGNLIYDRLRAKIAIRDTVLTGGHKFTFLFKTDDTISTLATKYDLTLLSGDNISNASLIADGNYSHNWNNKQWYVDSISSQFLFRMGGIGNTGTRRKEFRINWGGSSFGDNMDGFNMLASIKKADLSADSLTMGLMSSGTGVLSMGTYNISNQANNTFISYNMNNGLINIRAKDSIWITGAVPAATTDSILAVVFRNPGVSKLVKIPLSAAVASPASPINSVQFNNAGSFGGDSLRYYPAENKLFTSKDYFQYGRSVTGFWQGSFANSSYGKLWEVYPRGATTGNDSIVPFFSEITTTRYDPAEPENAVFTLLGFGEVGSGMPRATIRFEQNFFGDIEYHALTSTPSSMPDPNNEVRHSSWTIDRGTGAGTLSTRIGAEIWQYSDVTSPHYDRQFAAMNNQGLLLNTWNTDVGSIGVTNGVGVSTKMGVGMQIDTTGSGVAQFYTGANVGTLQLGGSATAIGITSPATTGGFITTYKDLYSENKEISANNMDVSTIGLTVRSASRGLVWHSSTDASGFGVANMQGKFSISKPGSYSVDDKYITLYNQLDVNDSIFHVRGNGSVWAKGLVNIETLKTAITSPATSGNTKVVICDADGLLSNVSTSSLPNFFNNNLRATGSRVHSMASATLTIDSAQTYNFISRGLNFQGKKRYNQLYMDATNSQDLNDFMHLTHVWRKGADDGDSAYQRLVYNGNSGLELETVNNIIGSYARLTLNGSVATLTSRDSLSIRGVPYATVDSLFAVGSLNAATKSNTVYKIPRLPYKQYVALISQSGTSDPTATELENKIGAIVWTRSTTGTYVGTLTGAFTANKTWCASSVSDEGLNAVVVKLQRTSDNEVTLYTSNSSFAAQDVFTNLSIEIRVYP